MSLSTNPTTAAAFLDIMHDGKTKIGQCYCDVDGFWEFEGFEAHTLREIADLLDGLNKPYNEELVTYFASLPPQISRDVQEDGEPF